VSQPPAARYQPAGSFNVVTQPTSALFNDTRIYAPANVFLAAYAATGQVTVAYAEGNNTGTIRKPLIVIEGYDPFTVLKANGISRVADYDYNTFVRSNIFGGINIGYTDFITGLRVNFNDQLSEVGQYDLIFLNFDNGTDFMQRNAYLVERLIQWVNDTKQPLPRQTLKEKNIVMGMSMGGLIARYALRDMEQRRASGAATFSHDAKLYISHEAPHQGANVPLGVQYMVSSLVNTNLGFGVTAGDLSPELKAFAKLLYEPATQQLLIYQTNIPGTDLHNAWLNEYNNTLGYPTQCRNVATSGGSECGRPQNFAPYTELLNIQGNGLLDEPYNNFANAGILVLGTAIGAALIPFAGPAAIFGGYLAGLVMSLGNFEGTADFVVNALPSQQQRRIYHGKFTICKEVLFGLFSTCLVDYYDDDDSDAFMLAYDSAPGGLYDINQLAGGLVGQIGTAIPFPLARVYLQPQFCFIPTTSALDIGGGGGNTALTPQDLTRAYASTAPPTGSLATPFANFISASRENLTHILWNGLNSKWAFQEMQGAPQVFNCQAFCQASSTISGSPVVCSSENYSVPGLPTNATVVWQATPTFILANSTQTAPVFVANTTANGGEVLLRVTISSECGQYVIERRIYAGLPEPPIASAGTLSCMDYGGSVTIQNFDAANTYSATSTGDVFFFGPNRRSIAVTRASFNFKTGGPGSLGDITLQVSNACGTTTGGTSIDQTGCRPAPTAALYPNPARETVDVHVTNATPAAPVTVRLFDAYGRPRAEQTSTGQETVRLKTDQFPAGLYFVHLLRGTEVLSRQQLRIEK